MIRASYMTSALVGAIAIVLIAFQPAVGQTPIKKLMGENFGGLQTILYALISANYAAVPSQVDVIRAHAEELGEMIPDSAKDERNQFLAYANNLSAHAKDMKTISELLMKRDQERMESSQDYLREALAAHYGGMVTMCVACHNRYRPLPVQ